MFHRISVEDWQRVLSVASFVIFSFVFVATAIRVWRLPKRNVEHMENLPLENDDATHA